MTQIPSFFEFKGQRIAWYRSGEGPALCLLHGWGSSADPFAPLCESLRDLRTCYSLDFPGFGKSDPLEVAWTPQDYADLVEAWLADIGITDTDMLVHSFGNRVLIRLLHSLKAREGEAGAIRIGKIIVTGGAGLTPRRSLHTRLKLLLVKTLKSPSMILPDALSKRYLDGLRSTALWRSMGSSDYARLSGPMRETFTRVVNDHLDSLLPSISREMLLIWGENDAATPPEQGRRLEKAMKGSALIMLEGAGHYAFLDQPARFAAIVRSYLSS
jgi:pimeloyl-ACP methyl ester carboxylesterase